MSTLDWSLHDPDLLRRAIEQREADPDSTIPQHPDRCGPCDDCAEYLREHGGGRWTLPDASPPTVDALVTHARKFGVECVIETAREYLLAEQVGDLDVQVRLDG